MNIPLCITFAGAVGSGKTPIATYLSHIFELPIFNNDAIRSEIYEDFGIFNEEEYTSRKNHRLLNIIKKKKTFICDVSVDRTWIELKKELDSQWYNYCIISLDISEELLRRFYKSKNYFESLERITKLLQDHENFLKNHKDNVLLHITDENFSNRLSLSEKYIGEWIDSFSLK